MIFWNSNHWEIRDAAIPYFDELKRVGIFHETPESAALHVSEVWDDVDAWWWSEKVQATRKSFCQVYSKPIKNYRKTLSEFLAGPS